MNTHAEDVQQGLWPVKHGVVASVPQHCRVGQSVRLYGEWLEQELELLGRVVAAGHTVLEFGGDYGVQTLWLARAVGEQGTVHVAEPRRLHAQTAAANLALNAIDNGHVHPFWLGRAGGMLWLEDSGASHDAGVDQRVRSQALDQLPLAALHLLKINFPGALGAVLHGGGDVLRRLRPVVYFRLGQRAEAATQDIATLKAHGYRCWSHLPYLYSPTNHAGSQQNIFPGWVSRNIIAAPVEQGRVFDSLSEV